MRMKIKNFVLISLLANVTIASANFYACPNSKEAYTAIEHAATNLVMAKTATPEWSLYQAATQNGVTIDYYTQTIPNGSVSDHVEYLATFLQGAAASVDLGITRHCYYPVATGALNAAGAPMVTNVASKQGQVLALEYSTGVDPNASSGASGVPVKTSLTSKSQGDWQPTRLVIFGDSLSDMGYQDNYHPGLMTCPDGTKQEKEPTYTSPCGHVWPYYLAKKMGIPVPLPNNANPLEPTLNTNVSGTLSLTASTPYNTDYAAGGAVSGGEPYVAQAPYFAPDVLHQIAQYTAQVHADPSLINSGDLYVLWIGANDVFRDLKNTDLTNNTARNANTNIMIAIAKIKAVNPTAHILVVDMVDIGNTPLGMVADSKLLSSVTKNQGLWMASLINEKYDRSVQILDTYIPTQTLYNIQMSRLQPYKTGDGYTFINNRNPACTDAVIDTFLAAISCSPIELGQIDPEQYVFADGVHPTDQMDRLIADIFYQRITTAVWLN
jgi:phospholipase/lecithinase/hemolysin